MVKKKLVVWMCISLTLCLLAACSNAAPQGQDPAAVKIELASDPSPAVAKQKVKIIAKITGLIKQEGAKVAFDIRKEKDSLPDLIDAVSDGKGNFTAEKTFDLTGTYTVYIHLYQEELHITKKKQLDVS